MELQLDRFVGSPVLEHTGLNEQCSKTLHWDCL